MIRDPAYGEMPWRRFVRIRYHIQVGVGWKTERGTILTERRSNG
jgi:hypothetical protein